MANTVSNSEYCEHLRKNLGVLVNNGRIGVSKFQSADIQTKPNNFLEVTKGFKNFHFCIDVPYAGKVLSWEVIFDPEDLSQLPDFDFNDYTFLPEPDINYIAENVPSWDTWNLTNPQSMLNILNEFLVLYKKAQVEMLAKQNRFLSIRNQYKELLRSMDLTADKVEILIELKNVLEYDGTSDDFLFGNFLIILPIDFSPLPEFVPGEGGEELINQGEDFAHLHIQMKKLDNSQTKVSLSLCPRAEQALGKLKLPKIYKNATLANYAQLVQATIEEQIKFIYDQFQARKIFVLAIVDTFSSGIVEYDATKFYKVSFIYEDFEDYDCLVTIQLGGKFPAERPKVQFHSLYCQVGKCCSTPVIYHLYDPDNSTDDNMANLREILNGDVKQFQNHKH